MIVCDDRVIRFVSEVIGIGFCPPFVAMGTEKNGTIINGVIFNVIENHDVHVSIAGHGWTRGFLADVGHYVFDTLGCIRMTAITEDPAVVRLAERLGGSVEGALRNHFGVDRPGYIVGILRDEYRF